MCISMYAIHVRYMYPRDTYHDTRIATAQVRNTLDTTEYKRDTYVFCSRNLYRACIPEHGASHCLSFRRVRLPDAAGGSSAASGSSWSFLSEGPGRDGGKSRSGGGGGRPRSFLYPRYNVHVGGHMHAYRDTLVIMYVRGRSAPPGLHAWVPSVRSLQHPPVPDVVGGGHLTECMWHIHDCISHRIEHLRRQGLRKEVR